MQLDVEVSPPASVITLNKYKWCVPKEHWQHFLVPDFFSSEFWSSSRWADRQTDRRTDRQKATPKSPPCISTGGLKNAATINQSEDFTTRPYYSMLPPGLIQILIQMELVTNGS